MDDRHLYAVIRTINVILANRYRLDAFFLIAHGAFSKIGFVRHTSASRVNQISFLDGDLPKDLFSKVARDGIIVTQAYLAGVDKEEGFACRLSKNVDGRMVIAPLTLSVDIIYSRRASIPFFFEMTQENTIEDTAHIAGVACFKNGKCMINLRSKL